MEYIKLKINFVQVKSAVANFDPAKVRLCTSFKLLLYFELLIYTYFFVCHRLGKWSTILMSIM